MSLVAVTDLRDFFAGPLADVRRRQRLAVTDATERYVLNLLAEGPTVAGPLALELARVQELTGAERLVALKQLGDAALYLAGWWLDAVLKGPMDPSYYAAMGERAYGTLAGAVAPADSRAVFTELASKFGRLVDVLQELYERTALQGPDGLMKLYERYMRTESDRLRWQLQAEGLLTTSGGSRLN